VALFALVAVAAAKTERGKATADGAVKPGSPDDKWQLLTTKRRVPLIHSLRWRALELTDRARFRWRFGLTWRFPHAQDNGMPGDEDRAPMIAIDDAIHRDFERDDQCRIVYFTTGDGIREVMSYAKSEAAAWARVDAIIEQFPDAFPGKRAQWAYVKKDANWSGYRAILQALQPTKH
jgi:hypothetical protein